MAEPNAAKGTSLQIDKLKKMVCQADLIQARSLYVEPIHFYMQALMVMHCNSIPAVPGADNGFWRRVRVVNFKAKLIKDPTPEQLAGVHRKSNPELMKTMETPAFRSAFMFILIEIWNNEVKHDRRRQPPDCVRRNTDDFKCDNDPIADWWASSEFQLFPATPAEELNRHHVVTGDNLFSRFDAYNRRSSPFPNTFCKRAFYKLLASSVLLGRKLVGRRAGRVVEFWGVDLRDDEERESDSASTQAASSLAGGALRPLRTV
jgi:phage/plasmid-associated DNA primase